ncbi:MAG: 16S rRNA (guanine(966)-N(2))-methyltransferase RsmD [Verrucomicrobiota bacterium JB023]|nr:16S rRNA (guanine(966)-N(2))-methyltransferase RsmD [Verrucomicrobiota bacterium JB023]
MRIIAGSCRGLKLKAPAEITRPTSDRVREAIFSMLQFVVEDAVVLDLFAGTGALGIEALSRGARKCTFVENHHRALKILRDNLALAKVSDRAKIVSSDALKYCQSAPPVDLILADPPYYRDGAPDWAGQLLRQALPLKSGGFLLLEVEAERSTPDQIEHFNLIKRKNYGSTSILLLEKK